MLGRIPEMKKNAWFALTIFCLLLFSALGVAHGEEAMEDAAMEEEHLDEPASYLPFDPFALAIGGFGIILLLSIISIAFESRLSNFHKKTIFALVAIIVVGVTLYAGGTTVYLNLISDSGGPVHWHADFEIWNCGEKIDTMKQSEGLSNFVGSPVLHYHNDYRIHVEGIVVKKNDASLGAFFDAVGGKFSSDSLTVPLQGNEFLTVKNGDLCNGKPGKLSVVVNGEKNVELNRYVLAPFFETRITGGKGDFIKIVFDSEEALNGS